MAKESRLDEIKKSFYTEEVYSDRDRYQELEREAEEIEKELEDLNKEWDTWT